MIVSVIVPCYNESKHIRAFLESVLSQRAEELELEVLIADGNSNDGTREILNGIAAEHPEIRVLGNPSRIVSTGLNAAIEACRGSVVLRMDVHTKYAPDYIVRCVDVLKSTGAENVGGPARTSANTFWGRAIAAAYHSRFACGGASFHDPEFEGYVDTVTYGCWWRTTFERIGLFDETLVRNQDDEFNLRLVRAGGTIWQSPSIVSWYSPRSSLTALFRQYLQYGFWKVSVIRKHRIPASWRHLVPGAFVSYVIGGLLVALLADYLGSPSVAGWSFAAWLTGIALYLLGCLGASARTAAAFGWDLFPVLPVVFATYHVSYGLGFLAGVANMSRIGRISTVLERTLSEVKR